LLDLGILVYLVLIPIVVLTGGFKVELLGISIKANHLYTPLKILMPLVFMRLILTLEFKNLILLLGSLILTLIVAETAIRVWDPPLASPGMGQIHRASGFLEWELLPGAEGVGSLGEHYHINSAGFRDTEHPVKKQKGVHRIMVIGDSFTFGMRVNLEDTYPKQLERFLNKKSIPSEVINCGVIGYNMWQHYELLKRRVVFYEPDLVILGLFEDDLSGSVSRYSESNRYRGEHPFESMGATGILGNVYIVNFLRNANSLFEYKNRYRRGHAYLKAWGPSNPTNLNYRIMSGRLEDKKRLEFSETLERFVKTASGVGAGVLVVLIPDSVQLNDPHVQAVNRFVEQVCAGIGVPFIDITPILEAEEDHVSLYLFPIDAHNSPKGLKIIARSIADRIVELGLLSSGRGG